MKTFEQQHKDDFMSIYWYINYSQVSLVSLIPMAMLLWKILVEGNYFLLVLLRLTAVVGW